MIVSGCSLRDIDGNLVETHEQFMCMYAPAYADFRRRLSFCQSAEERHAVVMEWELDKECLMGVFKDRLAMGPAGVTGSAFVDVEFAREYPILSAFLTSPVDDDGKTRTTSTIMHFVEHGTAKAMLKERDQQLSLWVTATSLLGVFRALEDALNENPVPWRTSTPNGGTRRVKP